MRETTKHMMRSAFRIFSVILLIFTFMNGLCGCGTSSNELTISAAASLTEAMEAVKSQWNKVHPEVILTFNFGSSGTLQKQIEEGAAVDLFISAAAKQMNALSDGGLIDETSRIDLVANSLILIVPKGERGISGLADLATDKATQVAFGEPGSVPAGQYAVEVFTKLGIFEAIKPKAVYGKDVKTVLTWVESGEAQAGIVYRTDAIRSTLVDVVAEAPADSHKPIVYPAAVIKNSTNAASAQLFLDWMKSGAVKDTFTACGFTWIAQ